MEASKISLLKQTVRWLLVPIVSFVAWYPGMALGLWVRHLFQVICPQDQIVSGLCYANWFPLAERFSLCLGAAAVAFLAVVQGAFMAPAGKNACAWIIFFMGALCALGFALFFGRWYEFWSAVSVGLLTAFWLSRRIHR